LAEIPIVITELTLMIEISVILTVMLDETLEEMPELQIFTKKKKLRIKAVIFIMVECPSILLEVNMKT